MDVDQLSGLAWISKSIAVAARLGVADHLNGRTLPYPELAKFCEADPDGLLALMEALVSVGIFTRRADGTFANSEQSELLKTDHPRSKRYICMLLGEMYYDAWGDLLHTVLTGGPSSHRVFGSSIYEYMDKHPEAAEVYDRGMETLARPVAEELARSYDFSQARVIVDVGGGNGQLLKSVLAAYPEAKGICADRPDVCERAEAGLAAGAPVAGRLSFRPVDFFERVPDGGDVYILKNVLHNWSAESGLRILAAIRDAMRRTRDADAIGHEAPALLVVEPLRGSEDNVASAMRALFQMTICEEGTRLRTHDELRSQLGAAGLTAGSTTMLAGGYSVMTSELASEAAEEHA